MNGAALPTVDDIDSAVTSGSYGNNYYASKNLFQENSSIQGPCPDGTLRTVGCQGEIHYFMPGTPNGYSVEYYMKNFAGPCGGPLTLYNPSIDNEGTASPTLASFYVEFGPLVNGLTRETDLFTANNVVDGSTDAATPIFAIGNVGAGTVQMDRITYVPSSEPYVQQSIVSCANPNAYGVIDNLVPHPFNWATSGYSGYGGAYSPTTVVSNTPNDGYYWRSQSNHTAGNCYMTCGATTVHQDNCPLAAQSWKTYWQRATMPAAWSSGTQYQVGNIVSSTSSQYYNPAYPAERDHQCLYLHGSEYREQRHATGHRGELERLLAIAGVAIQYQLHRHHQHRLRG